MEFRKAIYRDIHSIMDIIREAQIYFKEQGIDQWQNNYPNIETIQRDIDNQNGYVLVEDHKVVGTVAVVFDGDTNYESIYQGDWLSKQKYVTIHRIAIASRYKGKRFSSIILKEIEKMSLNKGIYSIKVDTHKENQSMRKFLQKNGFQYCGIVYLEDHSERVAYEKIVQKRF